MEVLEEYDRIEKELINGDQNIAMNFNTDKNNMLIKESNSIKKDVIPNSRNSVEKKIMELI